MVEDHLVPEVDSAEAEEGSVENAEVEGVIEIATTATNQDTWHEIADKVVEEMTEEEVEGGIELAIIVTKKVIWQENVQKEIEETEDDSDYKSKPLNQIAKL